MACTLRMQAETVYLRLRYKQTILKRFEKVTYFAITHHGHCHTSTVVTATHHQHRPPSCCAQGGLLVTVRVYSPYLAFGWLQGDVLGRIKGEVDARLVAKS